jgi:hypothetical protein
MDIIPKIEELKVIASRNSLSVFESIAKCDLPAIDLFLNKENPINEFMELVQSLSEKHFFVDYLKTNCKTDKETIEMFGIDLSEITNDFYGEYQKDILKQAKEFNNKLLKFPKDHCYCASLFVISSGILYVSELETESSLYFGRAEEWMDEICSDFKINRKKLTKKKKEESDKKREETYDKMVGELINDGIFLKCNTKASRSLFLYNYFRKNNIEKPFGDYYDSPKDLEAFADLLFADIKSRDVKLENAKTNFTNEGS